VSVWIVNASPVIALAKVRQLQLLDALGGEVWLPEAVAIELVAGPEGDPARMAVVANWGRRCSPSAIPDTVVEWGLGAGETAVLAVAMERQPATAVLDDGMARSAARALGIPLIGTLGVVVRARRVGIIPSAGTVMRDLKDVGLRLDDTLVGAVLERIGERWIRT